MNILLSEKALPRLQLLTAEAARVFWMLVAKRIGNTNLVMLTTSKDRKRIAYVLERLIKYDFCQRLNNEMIMINPELVIPLQNVEDRHDEQSHKDSKHYYALYR